MFNNNKQREAHLNLMAEEVPIIDYDLIKKKIKFIKAVGQSKRYVHYTNMLYVHKGIRFIIEVAYSYNQNFDGYVVLHYSIISAYFDDRVFLNCYFIMSHGYRANSGYSFKYRSRINSFYQNYLIHWEGTIKGSHYERSLDSFYQFKKPIYETMYKVGLSKWNNEIVNDFSNKPRIALGLYLLTKEEFKELINWTNKKKIDMHIFRLFLEKAKQRKLKNIFVENYKDLYDEWTGLAEQRKNKKALKEDLKKWNQIKSHEAIILIPLKNQNQIKKLGVSMNNCLKNGWTSNNNAKLYEVRSHATTTPLALEVCKSKIKQLKSFGNGKVGEQIHNLIQEVIKRKEVKYDKTI